MGSQNCDHDPVEVLTEAVSAGITAFQYREKGVGALTGKDKLELGKQLREICAFHQVLFIVNDDIKLVEPLSADGIHVGQDDLSVSEIRRMFPDKIIGLSVSNMHELRQSYLSFVNYIGAGPIYHTSTKSDAKSAVGVQWIETLRAQFPNLPIVGIGGIDMYNAPLVLQAGADGVSVISAITKASNIKEAVEKL
jgi:thiamine-phosphate pyrophosphorylase